MKRKVATTRRQWPAWGLTLTLSLLAVTLAMGAAPTTKPTTKPAAAEPIAQPIAAAAADPTAADPATQPAAKADSVQSRLTKLTPSRPRPELPAEVTQAYIIPIRDDIMPSMLDAIRRKLVTVKGQGAELIIFDFNTNGGRVDTADEIAKLIREELGDIRTVAWVNSKAISAGAWLALTCDEMVMVPHGKIGDCAPIAMGGELKGVQREKVESYITADFRLAAEANGYPVAVLKSMVRMDMEVWLVESIDTGHLRYVDAGTWRSRIDGAPGATTQPTVAKAEWRFVKVAVPKGELLTATTSEAREFGLVKAIVGDMAELQKLYNITVTPTVLSDNWGENIAAFMTSPLVTGLLVMLAMFFGYIEINTPGFGIGGMMALICLAILFASRYLTGLAQWWEIAVFVVGVILLMLEVFVTPGFGVLGISGGFLCVVGLLAMLIANPPEKLPIPAPGLMREMFVDGLFGLASGFLAGCALCVVVGRYLPKLPIASRLVLADVPTDDALPADPASTIRRIAQGDTGITETACRPAGKARFDDELIDVMTEGGFLTAGTTIVVMRNEGNRLVVEPAEPTA